MSITGAWDITINSPMGANKGTLTLAVDGSTMTGTMSSAQGETDIQDGKADGNEISWTANIPSPPIKLTCTATIDGDSISGNIALGVFGNATLTGTRSS